jgi:hypothetical protein
MSRAVLLRRRKGVVESSSLEPVTVIVLAEVRLGVTARLLPAKATRQKVAFTHSHDASDLLTHACEPLKNFGPLFELRERAKVHFDVGPVDLPVLSVQNSLHVHPVPGVGSKRLHDDEILHRRSEQADARGKLIGRGTVGS